MKGEEEMLFYYEIKGSPYEFEADDEDVREALARMIAEDYIGATNRTVVEGLTSFIEDFDLLDTLKESYKDELRDFFEEKAREEAEDEEAEFEMRRESLFW